ncbi:MAG TPA: hypothetical protein DEP47_15560 [Chloroflexi bacterium]|nr:hypothetical protein [Chloroflexota bacterium]
MDRFLANTNFLAGEGRIRGYISYSLSLLTSGSFMPGKTIILVDDDPEIVKTVQHYLPLSLIPKRY